ncbi:cytochrome P450 [Dactylosporangium sp. NPDC005572]|uniref:cytochrome P450 n=1 Tax=Dactylosporangium sp. NPDC005572 TaxID=3156889 RepID=UPI0033BF2C7D
MTESAQDLEAYPMVRQCPFDPPRALAALQAGEKVRRVRLWDGSAPWLVTGYDDVRAVLSDPRISSDTDRPGFPHFSEGSEARRRTAKTFINMDGREHDAKRRLLTRYFTVKRTAAMRPQIQALVDGLVDELLAGPKPVDLVEALALPVPSLVICDLMGVPYTERDLFHRMSRTMISQSSTPEQAVGAMEAMFDFLDRMVSLKDDEPRDDLISNLVVEQLRPGLLSRAELVSMLQLLLTAGHETTANMIALGTLALLRHPEVLDEVRSTDDPELIANTVEELLRWLNVVHTGRRRVALADLELVGEQIKAGEGVIAAHDIANRDPAAFDDPDRLDIHRKARHHIAFAYGVHQCLGQSLARVELQVVYGTLYRRVPTLALATDFDAIRFKASNIVYGVEELPVTW